MLRSSEITNVAVEMNPNPNEIEQIETNEKTITAACLVLMNDSVINFAKEWHSAQHASIREVMEQCINHLILQRRSNADQSWVNKLKDISKRVEIKLYHSSESIEEYGEPFTLVDRIQKLVQKIVVEAADYFNQETANQDSENAEVLYDHTIAAPEPQEQPFDQFLLETVQPRPSLEETKQKQLKQSVIQERPSNSDVADRCDNASVTTASTVQQTAGTAGAARQVSSQGCSRVFIIKVLMCLSEYVKGKALPSIFTFKRDLVMLWLTTAKEICCRDTYDAEETYFGGPLFCEHDASTHWTEPHQLYTWWKNNVERRTKFKVLQEDAHYVGTDPRRIQRARWCEALVALSEIIRSSSGSSCAARAAAANAATPSKGKGHEQSALQFVGVDQARSEVDGGLDCETGLQSDFLARMQQQMNDATALSSASEPFSDNALCGKSSGVAPVSYAASEGDDTVEDVTPLPLPVTVATTAYANIAAVAPLSSATTAGQSLSELSGGPNLGGVYVRRVLNFPARLFDLLSEANPSVVCWLTEGDSFQVLDQSKFVSEVLPKFFKHTNFTSFQRQLNLYGFRRTVVEEKGVYSHPFFRQHQRAMAESIERAKGPLTLAQQQQYLMPSMFGMPPTAQSPAMPFAGWPFTASGNAASGGSMPAALPWMLNTNSSLLPSGMPAAGNNLWSGTNGSSNNLGLFPPFGLYPQMPYLPQQFAQNGTTLGGEAATTNPYQFVPNLGGYGFPPNLPFNPFGAPFTFQPSSAPSSLPQQSGSRHRVVKEYMGLGNRKRQAMMAAAQSSQSAEQFLEGMYRSERYDLEEVPSAAAHVKAKAKKFRTNNFKHQLLRSVFKTQGKAASELQKVSRSVRDSAKEKLAASKSVSKTMKSKLLLKAKSSRRKGEVSDADSDSLVSGNEEDESADDENEEEELVTSAAVTKRAYNKTSKRWETLKKGKGAKPTPSVSAASAQKPIRIPQSRQNTAEGTIEPFRASYVTNGRNRLDRLSVQRSSTSFDPSQIGKKNAAPPAMSTRVGADFQAIIPVLQSRPAPATKRTSHNKHIVWSSSEIGLSEEEVGAYLSLIRAKMQLKPVAVGTVLVVFISELGAHKLCCVLDVDEQEVVVFDGFKEWTVPSADCCGFTDRHIDLALAHLYKSGLTSVPLDVDLSEVFPHQVLEEDVLEMPTWATDDVRLFCDAVKRFGDNIRKIWLQNFEDSKSLQEVLEFYVRIYPHTLGSSKRLISIHHRAELASAGYPNGMESSSSSSSEEEEELVSLENSEEESVEDGDEEQEEHGGESNSSSPNEWAIEELSASSALLAATPPVKLAARKITPSNRELNRSVVALAASEAAAGEVDAISSERKSQRRRSLNSAIFNNELFLHSNNQSSSGSKRSSTALFCVCRTRETDGERYIACSVGRPDLCNGWVHLSCAGLSADMTEDAIASIRDFTCSLCATDESHVATTPAAQTESGERVSRGKDKGEKGLEKRKIENTIYSTNKTRRT